MLRIVKEFYGAKLGASDGEIGHVKDFYFEDQDWAVRYVVADTGSWLPGQQLLLSPHAFGSLHQTGKLLIVNLTRKQIKDSPPIESHKPVSRQYEELNIPSTEENRSAFRKALFATRGLSELNYEDTYAFPRATPQDGRVLERDELPLGRADLPL